MRYIILSVVLLTINHVYGQRLPTANATLMCNVTSMKVSFPHADVNSSLINAYSTRDFEIKFYGQEGVSGCSMIYSNTTNVDGNDLYIEADYNNCGINTFEDSDDNLIYNQTVIILYGTNPNSTLVYREEHDEYIVQCIKNRNLTISLNSSYVNVSAKAIGKSETNTTAQWDIKLTRTDPTYTTEDNSATASLGDTLYFDMLMTTVRSDINLFTQDCYAVSDSGSENNKYPMITDRCKDPNDASVSITKADKLNFQWRVEAFKYFNKDLISIYIKCDVAICLSTSIGNGDCNHCQNRKRREITSLTGEIENYSEIVEVRSPVFMIVDKKTTPVAKSDESSMFSGTNGTIILALVAVIVLIAALVVIKKFFFTTVGSQAPAVSMKTVAGYDNKAMI